MPADQTPPGECPQCWHHAHVLHRGNWLGFRREPECEPCLDHMHNGCGIDRSRHQPRRSL